MSSRKPPPGAAARDQTLYSGRQRLGFIRASSGGVLGFDADGAALGSFPSVQAAKGAILARSREAGR